jgi:hypothetical protein
MREEPTNFEEVAEEAVSGNAAIDVEDGGPVSDPSVEELVQNQHEEEDLEEDSDLPEPPPEKPNKSAKKAHHENHDEEPKITPKMRLESMYQAALQMARNASYPESVRKRFTEKADGYKKELDQMK